MIRLLLVLILVAQSAAAQDRVAAIEDAWRGWLGSHRVGNSALAVLPEGAAVHVATRGLAADSPAPLASLSKAITAACVADLVGEGRLSYDTPVAEVLGHGDGTIADLLTHTSGLWPDATQTTMWDWVNDTRDRHGDAADQALARDNDAPGSYRYNNENYAVLGAAIEALTGQSYEAACRQRVIAPLSLTSARRSPRYGAFLAWGGWEMSAADYARFFAARFPGDSAFEDRPHAPAGQGASYGLGALHFRAEGVVFSWHTGLLCFGSIDGAGAYVVQVSGAYTAVVTFEGCPGEGALADLDVALLTAILR